MGLARNIGKIIGKDMKVSDQSVKKASKSKNVSSSTGEKTKRFKLFVDKLDDEGNVVKSIDNIYTGKKLNPIYSLGGTLAVAGVTAAQIEADRSMAPIMAPIKASKKNVEHIGSPEIMLYDGVGQESAPRNLNAHGDLVFGLHNQRRG